MTLLTRSPLGEAGDTHTGARRGARIPDEHRIFAGLLVAAGAVTPTEIVAKGVVEGNGSGETDHGIRHHLNQRHDEGLLHQIWLTV
ncbi:hypothetical protein AAFG13_04795 [Bradyrhizobium sp. B124]|uniref:hypothetical protein n=1 Tax=Bradyrhizobium sp. B124 TaxID=3140245 RepID=UPI003182C615